MGDAREETDGTIRFDLCADADASFAVEGGAALVAGRRPAAPTCACTPCSRTVFAGSGRGDNPLFQSLGIRDWTRDRVDSFDFGPRQLVVEALFAPRPGGTAEMDGWLLGASINLDARASELHVFDARRVAAGPICTWRADVALPISLHGRFKAA